MAAVFLEAIDARARDDLRARAIVRSWSAGETLFHEGEPADRVLVVTAGLVKAVTVTDDGRTVTLAMRGRGEILGELAAVDHGPRSASVVAIDDVEALSLAVDSFSEFLRAHPDAARVLLGRVAERLRDTSRRQAEFGHLETAPRVARVLGELADRYGVVTADGVEVRFSQDELAELCGASREAVARALRTLRDAGVVATARRTITVLDADGLRRSAG